MSGIPIKGKPKGSAGQAFTIAKRRGAERLDFLRDYLVELYQFAPNYGIDPDVLVAQFSQETGDGTSTYFKRDGNVAGFGAFDDGTNEGHTFTPAQAARAQVIHMALYLGLKVPEVEQGYDPRWKAGIDAGYFGTVTTTADLGNGLWATDPDYAQGLYDRYVAYWGMPSEGAGTVSEREYKVNDVYVLLVSGHRSTGDPGNPAERDLTDDLARAYTSYFRSLGFRADWFQRDLDGDNLPDMTKGDLTTVSIGARNAIRDAKERLVVMLDLHYNGPHSVVHAIVPDNVGLRTGFANGAPAADTAANNTLDVALGTAIAQGISRATGLKLYNGRLKVPGVMSERDTGVAQNGNWRLGMFAATAPYRMKAVRLVIEHAGYQDVKQDAAFFNACAKAAGLATVQVLGITVADDAPQVPDDAPAPAERLPQPIPGLDPAKLVQVVDGSMFTYSDTLVRATEELARLRFANDSPEASEGLSPVLPTDPPFRIRYVFVADNGKLYAYSSYYTRFDATKLEIVQEDSSEGTP